MTTIAPTPGQLLHIPGTVRLSDFIRPHRVSRRSPCPICGGESECTSIPLEGYTHTWCTRVESPHMQRWGFKGQVWYHRQESDGTNTTPESSQQSIKDFPLASPQVTHAILSEVARLLKLTDEHKVKLFQRGYSTESLSRHLFASLPADLSIRYELAVVLLFQNIDIDEILGTYGFRLDGRRKEGVMIFLGHIKGTALIEFRHDAQGHITGFQIAPDNPETGNKGKIQKRLSPPRMIVSGMPHIAQPPADAGSEIWHTEGIHKANLVAEYRNAIATGALGAGNFGNMFEAIQALDPEAKRLHVLAIDADQWDSRNEKALAHRLYDAGYRVAIARWDASQAKGPDDAVVAHLPIVITSWEDDRPKQRRDRRIEHAYTWQRRQFNQDEHNDMLANINARLQARVLEHIKAGKADILAITAPPGTGKSHAIAELGRPDTAGLNPIMAWVAARHDMVSSIPLLGTYRHIRTADRHNCPDGYRMHEILMSKHYNTAGLHRDHYDGPCAYARQFRQRGSAVWQRQHINTSLLDLEREDPITHKPIPNFDTVIMDENDLPSMLPERRITVGMLQGAAALWEVNTTGDKFLRVLQAVLTDCAQEQKEIQGKAVFDAINAKLKEEFSATLSSTLGHLQKDKRANNPRPWPPDIEQYASDAIEQVERLHKVTLPFIFHELIADLVRWQKGKEWNSRIRIAGAGEHGYSFYITEPVTFSKDIGPLTILDATCDAELTQLLFGRKVITEQAEILPPPHMRHIAIRSGKQYGKVSLESTSGKDLDRAIAEVKYILADLDPNGTKRADGKVALITFAEVEDAMGEALGIPEKYRGHFWGVRGSNAYEQCDILLVVGTPSIRPDDVVRMARALWHDDDQVIDPTSQKDEKNDWHFVDPRVEHLSRYLIESELTQCAHRNRPLRYNGRTVVTFCDATVADLPITTEIVSLPTLTKEGEEKQTKQQQSAEARMDQAIEILRSQGEPITKRSLAGLAKVSASTALTYLHKRTAEEKEQESPAVEETTQPTCTDADQPIETVEENGPIISDQVLYRPWSRWERIAILKRQGMSQDRAIMQELREWHAWQAEHVYQGVS